FADASGWNGVAEILTRKGYPVIAPANALRGISVDSAYLHSLLDQIPGPVLWSVTPAEALSSQMPPSMLAT
ncbi:MAG: hypothetical protein ABJD68_18100, partial [Nakamurella sp.]